MGLGKPQKFQRPREAENKIITQQTQKGIPAWGFKFDRFRLDRMEKIEKNEKDWARFRNIEKYWQRLGKIEKDQEKSKKIWKD